MVTDRVAGAAVAAVPSQVRKSGLTNIFPMVISECLYKTHFRLFLRKFPAKAVAKSQQLKNFFF